MRRIKWFFIAAMLIGINLFGLTSCGKETTELTWCVYDCEQPEEWQENVNELLKKKGLAYRINVYNVSSLGTDFGTELFDYEAYMRFYFDKAGQETMDLIGMPSLVGYMDFYEEAVRSGLLEPLDSYLESDQEFSEIYPERIWNVMRVNGTVYGLLNTWENFKQYYVFNENYLDKYDITVEDHMEMENICDLIQFIKEKETENGEKAFRATETWRPFRVPGYEDTVCSLISIDTRGESLQAVNTLDIPEVQKNMEMLSKLFQEECISVGESEDFYEKGQFLLIREYSYSAESAELRVKQGYCSGAEIPLKAVACPEGDNVFSRWGYVTGIAAGSRYKAEAAEFLSAVYTDRELSDALAYGKEQVDYQRESGKAELYDYGQVPFTNRQWFGNNLILTPSGVDSENREEELRNIYETLPVTKMAGKSLDLSNMESELQQVMNVYDKYTSVLFGNGYTEEKRQEIKMELEKAGIQKILDEMNRQLEGK